MKKKVSLSQRIAKSPEGMRIWQQERVITDITERVCELLVKQEVSRSELAERLGKTRGYITQLLGGDSNFTVRTISDVFLALGRQFHVQDLPISLENDHATVFEFSIYSEESASDEVFDDVELVGVKVG